jgi:hypothetical protein
VSTAPQPTRWVLSPLDCAAHLLAAATPQIPLPGRTNQVPGPVSGCTRDPRAARPIVKNPALGRSAIRCVGPLDIVFRQLRGAGCDHQSEVDKGALARIQCSGPGITGHVVGKLRIAGANPQDRAVSHDAVAAVVGSGVGHRREAVKLHDAEPADLTHDSSGAMTVIPMLAASAASR